MDAATRARLVEQQNKQKLTVLSQKMKRIKYTSIKYKDKQDSCCICVEDFNSKSMVRETPCKHVFHDECLMKWVETKVA